MRWAAAGVGFAAGTYAAVAATAWFRYGRVSDRAPGEDADPLLDHFMPDYEIVERHHVRVSAPADVVMAAACEMFLERSPIIRALFKGRALVMGSRSSSGPDARPFLVQMEALGWGRLAEIPGREVVMGAVTQPWKADVVFRPVPPDTFAAFDEPEYVKIAWTLRADPAGADRSIFRTETRAVATDSTARARFRRYWSLASPGIALIRRMSLGPLKADAERRFRQSRSA
ncbi:MAG: hypothetical protein ACHQO8_12130 [Vicinamibacterales bacterium]